MSDISSSFHLCWAPYYDIQTQDRVPCPSRQAQDHQKWLESRCRVDQHSDPLQLRIPLPKTLWVLADTPGHSQSKEVKPWILKRPSQRMALFSFNSLVELGGSCNPISSAITGAVATVPDCWHSTPGHLTTNLRSVIAAKCTVTSKETPVLCHATPQTSCQSLVFIP